MVVDFRNADPSDMTVRGRRHVPYLRMHHFTTYYYQGSLVTSFHYIMTFHIILFDK